MSRVLLVVGVLLFAPKAYGADVFPIDVDVNHWKGTPLDFSALNHPLGVSDTVYVRGAAFMRVGADAKKDTADDERIKFFGVNLAFGANFPTRVEADRLAVRLAVLGVNLVRVHHIDTRFADEATSDVVGVLRRAKFPTLDTEAVGRLRYLVQKLAAAGIHVDLGLHVGYTFDVARDELTTPPRGFRFPGKSKPYHMLADELIARQADYACRLVGGLGLAGAPVLAMAEINNESSLVEAWQTGRLEPAALVPDWTGAAAAWARFQAARGWQSAVGPVSFADGSSEDKLRYVQFLVELDGAYLAKMRAVLQKCTRPDLPVTGTQLAFAGGLAGRRSHAAVDFLDTHTYVDHYQYPRGQRETDWTIQDESLALRKFYPLSSLAVLRDKDKPFTISEFNQPWPNRYGYEIDLGVAAFGAVQDWDALLHFNYANNGEYERRLPQGFNLHGDPARLAAFAQAARLFRTVRLAQPTLQFGFTAEQAYKQAADGVPQRKLAEIAARTFDVKAEAAFQYRVASTLGPRRALTQERARPQDQIRFLPAEQRLFVRTRDLWAVDGRVQGGRLGDDKLELRFTGSAPVHAMAVLSALDGRGVGEARRLLLTIPGAAWRSRPGVSGKPEPETLTSRGFAYTLAGAGPAPSASLQRGAGPVWLERQAVSAGLQLAAGKATVYPLAGTGARLAPLPAAAVVRDRSGRLVIDLAAEAARSTPWYEIVVAAD